MIDRGPWDDYEPRDYLYVLPETFVRAVPFVTAPEYDCWNPKFGRLDHEQQHRYYEWTEAIRFHGIDHESADDGQAHVLGEPMSIQDHVRHDGAIFHSEQRYLQGWPVALDPTLSDAAAWEVLLSLHMGDAFGLEIHDGGALQVLVPSQDLADGRLDRLVCANDSS